MVEDVTQIKSGITTNVFTSVKIGKNIKCAKTDLRKLPACLKACTQPARKDSRHARNVRARNISCKQMIFEFPLINNLIFFLHVFYLPFILFKPFFINTKIIVH